MQSYCYHIKFELYPSPDPTPTSSSEARGSDDHTALGESIWVPNASASIFDDLPSHPKTSGRRRDRDIPVALGRNAAREALAPSTSGVGSAVIDCGASRAVTGSADEEENDEEGNSRRSRRKNLVFLSERQWRARAKSSPPPRFSAGIGPRTAAKDWRFGKIRIESFDRVTRGAVGRSVDSSMAGERSGQQPAPAASLGPNLGGIGQATKGRYMQLETKNTEAGWGVVHLYRESDESNALRALPESGAGEGEGGGANIASGSGSRSGNEDDGTILCIPAVPSYLSPSDFLGFIGEKWRGDVSHYRMVMTSRLSRYMVLMKFRNSKIAEQWRKEFDGKPFDSVESEICHVTFIKSITVEAPSRADTKQKAPHDSSDLYGPSSPTFVSSLKPFPPPTPNLIELPTCPVCLERMDDTAGLMTILCQHVFHCTCLQTWKGSGCPVCRATNPPPNENAYDPNNPYSQPFGSGVSNLCSVCDSTEDLWICLICGNVGCGRYKGGHAKEHWKETAHSFSLELETQHVWDYAGDMWVHRLIRDKGDGKVVDFSSNNNNNSGRRRPGQDGSGGGEEEDVVPRAKLDGIGREYTHLLTSQLESQRIYFEEMVNKAADKAAKAAAAAESASAQAHTALHELATLREEHRILRDEIVPSLERELARERARAARSTDLARDLGKSLQEERKVSEGLMARIEHLNREVETVGKAMAELRSENEELKETNRDLTMFISGQEKLKELENEGQIEAGELEGGTMSVPEEKKKGKGKGRKR